MSREIRDYARVARNFLEMVADGIGKVEPLADRLPSMRQIRYMKNNPQKVLRKIPYADYFYRSRESNVLRNVLIAGALVGTAALIYSTLKSKDTSSDNWRSPS